MSSGCYSCAARNFKLNIIDVSLSGHLHPLFDVTKEVLINKTCFCFMAVLNGNTICAPTLFHLSASLHVNRIDLLQQTQSHRMPGTLMSVKHL